MRARLNASRNAFADVVDDLLGTPAVLDATKKCRLTFKINISPCEPQEISAPGTSFKTKFDKGSQPRIACIFAGLQKTFAFLVRQPHIALVIYGGTLHVLGVDRIDDKAKPTYGATRTPSPAGTWWALSGALTKFSNEVSRAEEVAQTSPSRAAELTCRLFHRPLV